MLVRRLGKKLIVVVFIFFIMFFVFVVNFDIGEKFVNELILSESLDQLNFFDKIKEFFLEEENGEQRIVLRKNVFFINGVGFIVGIVIGFGIFVLLISIFEEINLIGVFFLIWFGCGLLVLFGSLCYVELGICIKKFGGEYFYFMEVFGRIFVYLFVWIFVLIIWLVLGVIIVFIFVEYVLKLFYLDCEVLVYFMKFLVCFCFGKILNFFFF